MIQLFIILLISLAEILIQTLYDTWLKKKGKPVKHTLETFIGICGVIAGILIFLNELPYDAKAYALAYYFSVRFMFYDLFYTFDCFVDVFLYSLSFKFVVFLCFDATLILVSDTSGVFIVFRM